MGRTVGIAARLEIRLLGPFSIRRDGEPVSIPRSRKVRALLAFLAIGAGSYSRSRLCGLLWDVPNDPRGELRWCLSKLRGLLDDPERRRVQTSAHGPVSLDVSDCSLDAIELERVVRAGVGEATTEQLTAACDLVGGDLLEGLEIDGNPEFAGWLIAQRQRHREMHVAVLRELVARAPRAGEDTLRRLHQWLVLAPFDLEPHTVMVDVLLGAGRARDAEQHIATAIRAFEEEGFDWSALRSMFAARKAAGAAPRVVPVDEPREAAPKLRQRASVAIMPFTEAAGSNRRLADGLTDDIITRLAKLRVLFVIARGTTYALRERGVDAHEAARILDVEYVVTGSVRSDGGTIVVGVELAETRRATIVWRDELETSPDGAFATLDAIVDRVVAGIADEIETAESSRAILKPPSSIDAWEAYHGGLWHMYKFTAEANRRAAELFTRALELDPQFARAWGGLSFTHFQNAFLGLVPDRDRQIEHALRTAERSVGADDRDPGAHWALGRALWLGGANRESFAEVERSVELSPNFAIGHYTLGFFHCQVGDPRAAIVATDHSRMLSPFDPLQFAMLCTRAISHLRLGERQEAAEWATKAASRPNAHVHILALAAVCLTAVGRRDDAGRLVARIRDRQPGYRVADLLGAFRFDADTEAIVAASLKQAGIEAG